MTRLRLTRWLLICATCALLWGCGSGEQSAAPEEAAEPEAIQQAPSGAAPEAPAGTVEPAAPPVEKAVPAVKKAAPRPTPPKAQAKQAAPSTMQTTPSGLQYQVLQAGDGPKPSASDTVTVHYRGTLMDGTVFDSSYDRGEPASFPLSRVIRGWTEGLQLMPVGSKYKFQIPPDLGYGARGMGGVIPPNATLIFEVELLSIN